MPRQRPSEAGIREAKLLYTTTRLPLAEITCRSHISPCTISNLARRNGWTRPDGPVLKAPTKRSLARAQQSFQRNAGARRLAILARALVLAEHHIAQAEELIAVPKVDILAREREARFIGTVITLVQRHQQAEAMIHGSTGRAGDGASDDADPAEPRSLDAVYRDFADQLAALLGGDAGAGPGEGADRAAEG